jgi:hypothetical protein
MVEDKRKESMLEARFHYARDLKALNENPASYFCLCKGGYNNVEPEQTFKLDFNSEYNYILREFLRGEIEKIDIILGI